MRTLHPAALLAFFLAPLATGQSTVPPACATLPGNAALSMPLRWSVGTMQVRIDTPLLPPNFVGQTITGLHMRRPTFLNEPAYGALTRTMTVRGGFQPEAAQIMTSSLTGNRPANTVVLFGPGPVTVGATPTTGPTSVLGAELFHIVFSTPLPVVAGTLFLEFETTDTPFQVIADNWVDAVWFDTGGNLGYQATVGNGSCSTLATPTQLVWDGASGPVAGGTAAFKVTGVPPGDLVMAWLGLDPQTAGGGFPGFGFGLALLDPTLAGCHLWAPLDATWTGTASQLGVWQSTFPLTGGATSGLRLGVQTAWLDPSHPNLPVTVSNGLLLVLNTIGIGNRCCTAYFPASSTTTPWYPYLGQMPVIVLDH